MARKPRQKLQCRAASKQHEGQCKAWALPGKTLCRHHGGRNEGRPALQTTKHGLSSEYVRKDQLPALLERVAELRTPAGKEHALLVGAALMEQRLTAVPNDVEYIDKFVNARKSVREDLKVAHEITQEEKPAAPTTFVIGNFDPQQNAPFQSRTLDGPCTVRYLEGAPFILDVPSGSWCPASEQTDEESGAKYYVRILQG